MKFMKRLLKKDTPITKIATFAMKTKLKSTRNAQKISALLKQCGVKENMYVLDYGAGIGSYAFVAAELVGANGSVLATDISKAMINEINAAIARRDIGNVKTLKVAGYRDVKASNFDFILLMDVIHMMDDQSDVIVFLLDKLKPQGKIIIKPDHISAGELDALFAALDCKKQKVNDDNCWLLGK